jgi:predicted unusual protein kinase regulating ubiquinone biosynthesis (AarF/ABC1/UbiB family)
MVLKFNYENLVSYQSFYYNYLKIIYYLVFLKIFKYFNWQEKFNETIYQLCLIGGPIFIKIAQNISNKDNINIDLKRKLLKFQDNNFDYCNNLIKSDDLKNEYNLEYISEKPIFAGSIALVYKCVYQKKECILKINHHDIKRKTILSINLFDSLIQNINVSNFNLNQLVKLNDIYLEILNQIDFNLEYKNLMIIKNNFKDFNKIVVIPDVFYYNNNVLIESFEDGLKFNDFIKINPDKAQETCYLISCCFFKMFFDNFIHVDFHESNLRFKVEDDTVKIIIYDFGMISKIEDKQIFLRLLNVFKKNIFVADPHKLADLFVSLNTNPDCDTVEFKQTIYNYIEEKNLVESTEFLLENETNKDKEINSLKPISVVKYIVNTAYEFNLKICDTIFNLLNSFILVEDFQVKYEKSNENYSKSYQKKYEYAEKNGFIENIKNSLKTNK